MDQLKSLREDWSKAHQADGKTVTNLWFDKATKQMVRESEAMQTVEKIYRQYSTTTGEMAAPLPNLAALSL